MYLNISQASWYVIGASTFFIFLFLLFALFYMKVKQKQNEMLLKEQRLHSQFSQTLLQSQLEIQEQTFKNISQEIHDNIGQALTLAKLNLNTMPAASEEQQQKITTTKELVSKAIVDLRDLSRSLNTDYIADMGLLRALEYELSVVHKSSGIKTELETAGEPFRLEQQKELILFRIVQEALNNTIKHAGATLVKAVIHFKPDELELLITDDGNGFTMPADQKDGNTSAGLGLRNMQNRATLIGAGFSLLSTPGKGTEVKIILPKGAEHAGNSAAH